MHDGIQDLQLRAKMTGELKKLAKTVAPFERIGDFKARNLAWDTEKETWIFFDWLPDHDLAYSKTSSRYAINELFADENFPRPWLKDVLQEVRQISAEARKTLPKEEFERLKLVIDLEKQRYDTRKCESIPLFAKIAEAQHAR